MNGIWICVYTDTLVGYPTHLYDNRLDNYNLSYIEVKEDVLFDWFKVNILEDFKTDFDLTEGISDRSVMDEWLDEYTADETVDLYNYMKEHNGLVREGKDTIDLIEDMIRKYLPHKWFDEGMEDIVDEIHFRIDGLDEPEKHIKACIDYILDMGNGDPVGIDILINEEDDGNIWDYIS